MHVYRHPVVKAVAGLHHELLQHYPGTLTVQEVVLTQADTLWQAHASGDPVACVQLSNWLPQCIGKSEVEILETPLSVDEARTAVSREHGFADWDALHQPGPIKLDKSFEQAVTTVLKGDINALRLQLEAEPGLISAQSAYGHRATLLHYLGSNGVETWRQVVPMNADEVAAFLIERGADKKAKMAVYGGFFTPLELMLTSAHPRAAGLTDALAVVLK